MSTAAANAAGTTASSSIVAGFEPATHPRPTPSRGGRYPGPPTGGGTWQTVSLPIVNNVQFTPGSMMLLTDGSILMYNMNPSSGGAWERLTPDSHGSYANGTWTSVAAMPSGYSPLYFASAVLPDGRVIVEGGEYNGTGSTPVETNLGAIYDPATDKWTTVSPPSGWTEIGDAQSAVLPDGTFMMGDCCDSKQALFDATNLTWSTTPSGKSNPNSEEGWTLLPSNNLFDINVLNTTPSTADPTELYSPTNNSWSAGVTTSNALAGGTYQSSNAYEIGPAALTPFGKVFATGATGNTAVFNTATNQWTAGPSFPTGFDVADGPSVTLPDGDVLVAASSGTYNYPAHFYDFNPSTSALTQEADTPTASGDSSYYMRMIVLPTGQVMEDDGSYLEIYTDPNQPQSSWAPTVTSVAKHLAGGSSYTVTGTQLAGLDQGSWYGDDNQSATNYPLVRITNKASGKVTYAPTTNASSYSVTPGTFATAHFTVPSGTPTGPSTLQVVANGIASAAVSVTVGPTCLPVTGATKSGLAVKVQLSCTDPAANPLTYKIVHAPSHGTLGTVSSTGVVTYTADKSFVGTDSFTYDATASDGTSLPATVSLTVAQLPAAKAHFGRVSVHRRTAKLKVRCGSGSGTCKIHLLLKFGRRKLGARGFTISPGHSRILKVSLNRRGRSLLAHHHRLRVVLHISQVGGRSIHRRVTFRHR